MMTDDPVKPGFYLTCDSLVKYRDNDIYFLKNHRDLAWVKTSLSEIDTVPHALRKQINGVTLYFGRYVSNGFTFLGKVRPASEEIKLNFETF